MIVFKEIPVDDGRFGCAHCGPNQRGSARPKPDVVREIHDAITGWECGLGPNIAFTGADPLGYADLLELIKFAAREGAQRVRVDCGMATPCTPERTEHLLSAGMRNLRVTLLGDERTHDGLCGGDGHFAHIVTGTQAFTDAAKNRGDHVSISTVVPVCKHNVPTLPGAVSQAAKMRASHALLRLVDGEVDLPAIGPWITAACDTGTVNRVWVEAEGIPYFTAPGHEIHLSNTVRSFPGTKTDVCEECAAEPWCDGITAEASPAMLANLVRRRDHERLAERLERARTEVRG